MKTTKSQKAQEPNPSIVRRVGDAAAFQSFSVISLHAEIMEPPEKIAGNHKLSTKVSATAAPLDDRSAEVLISIQVSIHRKESDPPWAIVGTTGRLIYAFSRGVPPVGDLEQFAKVNGVFNAWPFLREIIQSTTLRMGIAPVMLPLHRVRATSPEGTPRLTASRSALARK